MKKMIALSLAIVSLAAVAAQADVYVEGGGFLDFLASCYTLSTFSAVVNSKEAYIQGVQDDATGMLAGEPETAMLHEAIYNLRTNDTSGKVVAGDDFAVAAQIVGATQ
jgi:hypothetical protein